MSEKETIIWLAGLLSTDGVVQTSLEKKHCFFVVYSVESNWLQVIHDRLRDIGIESTVHTKEYKHSRIQIHNPQWVRTLFIEYHCELFFNPRKWKKILEAPYTRKRRWNPEEDKFLIEKANELSDFQIAKELGKTKGSVYQRRIRLGIWKPKWRKGSHNI